MLDLVLEGHDATSDVCGGYEVADVAAELVNADVAPLVAEELVGDGGHRVVQLDVNVECVDDVLPELIVTVTEHSSVDGAVPRAVLDHVEFVGFDLTVPFQSVLEELVAIL
jgi:hypothetical protein